MLHLMFINNRREAEQPRLARVSFEQQNKHPHHHSPQKITTTITHLIICQFPRELAPHLSIDALTTTERNAEPTPRIPPISKAARIDSTSSMETCSFIFSNGRDP